MGSIDLEQNYREKIATRVTIAGDTALASNQGLTPFGTPFVPFPLFPFMPAQVEHIVLNGTVPTALQHAPIGSGSEVITPSNLGSTPVIPYVNGVDYTIDYAAGTIVRVGAGGITDGGTVKVTYAANPMVLLTHMQNFIVGLSRDIRIEKDRDIFKRVNQYAITCKVAVEFEELDAIALVKNIGTTVS
jgi:hypothetical protein